MIYWWLITVLLTVHGIPAADIPRPFVSQQDCQVEGLKRAAQIADDEALASGVWACLDVDFTKDDPRPPPAPLPPKVEG